MYNPNRKGLRGRFFWFLLIALAFVLVLGGVVTLLWNNVLSPVLNVRTLTYGQGIGLLVLCRILFGSFRKGTGGPPSMRYYGPWRTKWMQMSAEEREKFKEEWKKRCKRPEV